MSKSTKSAGMTAMAHARAWVNEIHPGSRLLEASKSVKSFPMFDRRTGEATRVSRTVREDIWGTFDIAVFPRSELIDLIQVTTIGRDLSAVRARQKKVGVFVCNQYKGLKPGWLGGVYVVGWVQRKHLRIWAWSWKRVDAHTFGGWVEMEPDPAKLPKRTASGDASTDPASTDHPMPF